MKVSKKNPILVPVEPLVVGKIGSVYGIYGWLRVFSFTEKSEQILDYQPWFIKRGSKWYPIELECWKRQNQDLIIKVTGIQHREAAMPLTNFEIIIDSIQLPNLDSGEYYWKNLLGCQVITVNGYPLGEVMDLMATGANDVLIVKTNCKYTCNAQEHLIPFLNEHVVKKVDLMTKIIEVDWDPNF
ncbi:ribosome maturation factor RimM [Candidatus Steffania adelgidicola]|uniref:ribosome maturation factor RimM n=1 Tax=Candidatus Steffania adelgidicola TaxID=1076626 RepID=UPI001D031A3D|nr:ribosome maturation factor RimM [Candidatus Steffania adelgidicola]UDG79649.1 Ribosome maturation factor RimM [Candidatus Steffania adelgidicola]